MKKRVWLLFLCILAVTASVCLLSSCNKDSGEEEKEGSKGIEYELSSNQESYAVAGIGECTDENVVISSKYNGKPVTTVKMDAFYNCSEITSITLPSSIKSIDSYAFYGCTELKNVVISEGTSDIGDSAFEGCTELASIILPNSVKNVGSSVFGGCEGLAEVSLGSGLKKISSEMFKECTELKEITVPSGVTEIGGSAFRECTELTSVTLGENVKTIGSYAFYGCEELREVVIPKRTTEIGKLAYGNCAELNKITFNAKECSDFSAESNVFSGVGTDGDGISVVFGNSVKKIPSYLFYTESAANTPYIKEITLGKKVNNIGKKVLGNCEKLEKITCNIENFLIVTYDEEWLYGEKPDGISIVFGDSVKAIPEKMFYKFDVEINSVTLGENVQTIGNSAFRGCTGLTSVTVPDSVTDMGKSAFRMCIGLTEVKLGEGLTAISEEAFRDCSELKSVTLSENIEVIGEMAFYNCSKLESVTLGKNITEIAFCAFANCTNLKTVNYRGTEEEWNAIAKYWTDDAENLTVVYNYTGN